MASLPPPIVLPQATVQHTFPDVLSEVYTATIVSEDIWLSCYKLGEASAHGKIMASLYPTDRNVVELSGRDSVELERLSEFRYRAKCSVLDINVRLVVPVQVYADPAHSHEQLPHQIPAFDLGPGSSLLASAFSDGMLSLYSLPALTAPASPYPSSQVRPVTPYVSARLHLSGIVDAHIFTQANSDPLLVTAGADFRLSLTPLPTTPSPNISPPPTSTLSPSTMLTGHTRALTSLLPLSSPAIASGARDGTVRIWDANTGQQSAVIATAGLKAPSGLCSDIARPELVYAGLADGTVQTFDVRARTSSAVGSTELVGIGALSAITALDDATVIVGGTNGGCGAYDLRASKTSVRWMRSGASIEALAAVGGARVFVGGEDGLPYIVKLGEGEPKVDSELVFGDVDAVRCVRARDGGTEVWAAGDGGVVRRYLL